MTNGTAFAAVAVDTDEHRRWTRMLEFVQADLTIARATAENALTAEDPRWREAAADVLGQVSQLDPGAAKNVVSILLAQLATEEDPRALDCIITAIGWTGDARARAPIADLAAHGDENVRFAVALALPKLGLDDRTLEVLRQLSTDPSSDVRDWATFALAESDATDAATLAALAHRVDDSDDDTRAEALFGLARRKDPRARALIEHELARAEHGWLIERALEELER